jgi:hypothetical protein
MTCRDVASDDHHLNLVAFSGCCPDRYRRDPTGARMSRPLLDLSGGWCSC